MKKYAVLILLLYGAIVSCKKTTTAGEPAPKSASFIDAYPFDIQYDKNHGWLYFFESNGSIIIHDIATNTVKKKVVIEATIGYCDFGEYNGVRELYVPRNDGWIFIYNATTLKLIDQISVGLASSCVAYNNGVLYISTDAHHDDPIKVYNRSTKQLIGQCGDFADTRIKKVPDTNTELLEITRYISPIDQEFYTFDEAGSLVSSKEDIYHGDYDLDAYLFDFFPTGNKYITSKTGAVYSKSMEYEASLPRGNLWFTSFAFDDSSRFIYSSTNQKSIVVYDANTYYQLRSITTKAYPYRIFYSGGSLVCVSSAEPIPSERSESYAPSKLLVEVVK